MAHEVETMAYAGALPWHGLGVPVSNDLTPAQMQQKAGLDWEVEKVDAYINVGGEQVPTGQQALIRTSDNTILTNVGENWNPVQNSEAFNFFSDYVMAGDMEMHTAGSLKNGQIVWALAKVKESFDVFGKEDQVDSYMLFSNPHQYGKAIDVRFTPIRVVCNNTLTLSLSQKADKSVKVGHRSVFNPEMVKEQLGIAHEKFEKYKEMAQFLGSKRFKIEDLLNFYNDIAPHSTTEGKEKVITSYEDLSRGAKMCFDALESQPGAELGAGTWWQAFNSVTYYTDHQQGRNAENRLYNQWFGYNQTRKVKAAESAVQYASAS